MSRLTIQLCAQLLSIVYLGTAAWCLAAPQDNQSAPLRQPLHRVAKNIDERAVNNEPEARPQVEHPIVPALKMANSALRHIHENIRGYSATMVKRETVKGQLTEAEYTSIKVRCRKVANGRVVVPFAVYMKYVRPRAKQGQEAIWIEGSNNNKIVAHGTGLQGIITVYLDPDGFIATRGTNYAIYDMGLEKMIEKLIERGELAKTSAECQVQYYKDTKINGRKCTLIQLMNPVKRPQYDFHVARVFVDDQLNVPIRYAAYNWPKNPGGKPALIEEFTYTDLKVNTGLTEADFSADNPNYDYP